MGFSNKSFDTPIDRDKKIYKERSLKRLIIIAFEGEKTEYQYFSYIKNSNNFFLKNLVEIELIQRAKENRSSSSPTQVVQSILTIIEDKDRLDAIKSSYKEFDDSYDIFWIVIDREKQESKKINLKKAIDICKDYSIEVSLSNPTFEFWLLLHFDISKYTKEDLFNNKKSSKRAKRYLETQLTQEIGSYNKSNIDTNFITIENIKRALEQEQLFENELEKIIDSLGSNVGDLIRTILDLEK
jgi:hypothetical protein